MSRLTSDVQNTLYKIHTPREVPLRFHLDGYFRLAADAECARCGGRFVQIIRCHRYASPDGLVFPNVKRPDPNDERVMSSFMIAACKNGVGNKGKHSRNCPVGDMPKGKFLVAGMSSSRRG